MKNTDWLGILLHSKFFGPCVHHQELWKNEENVFCIDCGLGFCRHCIKKDHEHHQRLKICKYVYHEVVRLDEVEKHLDCSMIQTYKINGEKAVHLNPRPQSKDIKPSKRLKSGGTCEACGRYKQELSNRFCSIACKLSAVSVNRKDRSRKLITDPIPQSEDALLKGKGSPETTVSEMESTISMAESTEETKDLEIPALKPRKRLHKRKGNPHPAPLF